MASGSSENRGKRRLPPKVAAMKARKRQKVNGDEARPTAAPRNVAKAPVRIEALPWKAISMPDHLDDYEGFFGLEEIDDVEVVKDEANGRISFMSKSVVEPVRDEVDGNEVDSNDDDDAGGDDDDEWSGFDDAHVEPSSSQVREDVEPPPSIAKTSGKKAKISQTKGSFPGLAEDTGDEVEAADISAWKDLKLSPDVLAALSKLQFTAPTSIQRSAIPEILAGHDVIGKASTGSGKTLAFGIPILEHFLENRSRRKGPGAEKIPLALILSPTRELAHQLDKHLTALCNSGIFEGPAIATLTGGLSLQKQQRLLKNADIIIGTPGRLWEVVSQGQGTMELLKQIRFLVIDEADRLLSQGNFKEVEEILSALDRKDENDEKGQSASKAQELPERQTLVFSATFDRSLQRKLATKTTKTAPQNMLSNQESMEYLLTRLNFRSEKPKFIDVNPVSHLVSGLKESLVECPAGTDKDLYLYALLLLLSNAKSEARILVFTNSISAVKRLTPFLQNLNLPALALHSGMAQKARLRSVERFTATQQQRQSTPCSILVATDVAARGLDIPNVQVVLHYHLPRAADTYVHRSGRTARAGQSGSSILVCAPEEVAGVRRLVAKVHAINNKNTAGEGSISESQRQGSYIRTLDLNRKIISRLKPRATLAKRLADVNLAKEKTNKEDDFMRAAAEELGVDYDSETFAAEAGKGKKGRGAGREKKAKEMKGLSKGEVAAMRAELKGLLAQRVNVGVSERYLTSGNVDVDELLRQRERGVMGREEGMEFLGSVEGLDLLEDI